MYVVLIKKNIILEAEIKQFTFAIQQTLPRIVA